jgi:hypothetical protein
VAISADGKTIAVSESFNDRNGTDTGSVRVYTFDSKSNIWKQIGNSITGIAVSDQFGYSIDMSADGTIIAIGAPGNGFEVGRVGVYSYKSSSNRWVQLGLDIKGEGELDNSGVAVALSADGKTIAIGA